VSEPFLVVYVVYRRPRDYPEHEYVVRRQWVAATPGNPTRIERDEWPCFMGATLEAARASIPLGKVRIERDPKDDPVIVETWL